MPADGLDREAVRKLVALAREVSFIKGAALVRQGEASRGAFLIRSGCAEARVALPGGGSLAVARFREGDMFGEMALVERGVCSASVHADSNVDAWFVGRDDFRALVASREIAALEIQRAITRTLADRLRMLNDRLKRYPAAEDRPAGEAPPAQDPLAGVARSRRASFDWRAFLSVLPFFEGFDADATDEFAAAGEVIELPRGAWVFAAGAKAQACYLVLRGALELSTRIGDRQRRVAIAGPGELVGFMAVINDAARANSARVREAACLLEIPSAAFLEIYNGASGATVSLHHAVHRSLLRSITRTNNQLSRLLAHTRLEGAGAHASELQAALHGQIWRAEG
ncbi:MAG: cyclic nucleotide-binding domain-containing protein [Betaproteobacteria bacterium]|nr:MAG: cyclic nucleotide-binding domain-containing protein [Betaproteobacteria bacterium]